MWMHAIHKKTSENERKLSCSCVDYVMNKIKWKSQSFIPIYYCRGSIVYYNKLRSILFSALLVISMYTYFQYDDVNKYVLSVSVHCYDDWRTDSSVGCWSGAHGLL